LTNYLEYLKHIRDECLYLVEKSEGLTYGKFLDDLRKRKKGLKSLFLIILAVSQKLKPGHKSSKTTEI
jgi:hypothetical protein